MKKVKEYLRWSEGDQDGPPSLQSAGKQWSMLNEIDEILQNTTIADDTVTVSTGTSKNAKKSSRVASNDAAATPSSRWWRTLATAEVSPVEASSGAGKSRHPESDEDEEEDILIRPINARTKSGVLATRMFVEEKSKSGDINRERKAGEKCLKDVANFLAKETDEKRLRDKMEEAIDVVEALVVRVRRQRDLNRRVYSLDYDWIEQETKSKHSLEEKEQILVNTKLLSAQAWAERDHLSHMIKRTKKELAETRRKCEQLQRENEDSAASPETAAKHAEKVARHALDEEAAVRHLEEELVRVTEELSGLVSSETKLTRDVSALES